MPELGVRALLMRAAERFRMLAHPSKPPAPQQTLGDLFQSEVERRSIQEGAAGLQSRLLDVVCQGYRASDHRSNRRKNDGPPVFFVRMVLLAQSLGLFRVRGRRPLEEMEIHRSRSAENGPY